MCSYEYPDFSSNFVHLPNFSSELDHTKFSESLNGSNVSYQDPRLKLSNLQSSVEPLSQYWYLAGLSHHLDRLPNLFLGNGYARTNPWPPINIKKKNILVNQRGPWVPVGRTRWPGEPRGQDREYPRGPTSRTDRTLAASRTAQLWKKRVCVLAGWCNVQTAWG